MWSIHDISVLFHCYTSPTEWPLGETPAYADSANRLRELGLIHFPPGGNLYTTTDKGRALIQMILDTPVPVQMFVDPRLWTSDRPPPR